MEIFLAMLGVVAVAALSDWSDLRRGKRMKRDLERFSRHIHGDDHKPPK
jgi:hypothetical protein